MQVSIKLVGNTMQPLMGVFQSVWANLMPRYQDSFHRETYYFRTFAQSADGIDWSSGAQKFL